MTEKKQEQKQENTQTKAKNRVTEILQETNAIDSYIEMFYKATQDSETPMTDEHKAAIKDYALNMASQWDEVLNQMESNLQDPNIRKGVEKSLKKMLRVKNPKKKETKAE